MATTSVRFGRGVATYTERNLRSRYGQHSIQTAEWHVLLDDGSLVARVFWGAEDTTFHLGDDPEVEVSYSRFEEVMAGAKLDWKLLRKHLEMKLGQRQAEAAEYHGAFGYWE